MQLGTQKTFSWYHALKKKLSRIRQSRNHAIFPLIFHAITQGKIAIDLRGGGGGGFVKDAPSWNGDIVWLNDTWFIFTGNLVTSSEKIGGISCANHMLILEEISWQHFFTMIKIPPGEGEEAGSLHISSAVHPLYLLQIKWFTSS